MDDGATVGVEIDVGVNDGAVGVVRRRGGVTIVAGGVVVVGADSGNDEVTGADGGTGSFEEPRYICSNS